jgi:type I restriction enzyme, S subunit
MKNTPLGNLATVMTGGTPDRGTPAYWGGSIPWVGTGEIDFNIIESPTEYLTERGLKESAARLLPKGTLLMAMYGQGTTRGKVGVLAIEAATNQACAAIIPKDGLIESEFLFYMLEASYTRIRRLSNTGSQKNLNTTLIREIPVPVLTKTARDEIVSAGREWNAAIEKSTALLTALEERKKGLMQQLLNRRRRLKGFKGKWHEVTLGNVLERITRKNSDSCNNALTVSAQRGLIAQDTYFAKQIASKANEHYVLLQRGEFAYNRSAANGYPFGAIKRLDSHEEGIVSTLCLCFGIRAEDVLDSDFLVWLIEAGQLNRAICKIAHEGARSHGLLNVTAKDFFDIKTTVPGFSEQRAIAAILNDAKTEIDALRGQVEALKMQKRALMQKLLSGDWCMPKTVLLKEFSA